MRWFAAQAGAATEASSLEATCKQLAALLISRLLFFWIFLRDRAGMECFRQRAHASGLCNNN
jgi:hypothetical protein